MKNLVHPLAIRAAIYLCLCNLSVEAQLVTVPSHSPEKIYLQLDNHFYTTDETIWFKAVVTRSPDHSITDESGVLYVELINSNEAVLERKLIRLVDGIGQGFFQLNQNYTDIHYQIRAYTNWNRNFGPDFFFTGYLEIHQRSASAEPGPIGAVTLSGSQTEKRIKASIKPTAIDIAHTGALSVIIAADDQLDTVVIKRSGKNQYLLDYPVPAGTSFLTLKTLTRNNQTFSKTIALREDFIDLQFFPEGGEMVHGLDNLLGFKAINNAGDGVYVSGDIRNSKGAVITTFSSNQLGMGSVLLLAADSSDTYVARIKSAAGDSVQTQPLPKVSSKGNILSVRKIRDHIFFKVATNYRPDDSVSVKASCRGVDLYSFNGQLRNGNWEFSILSNSLPDGIIAFTLFRNGQPVSERLYFNERKDERLNLVVTAAKTQFKQREQSSITISSADNAEMPVDTELSAMVIHAGPNGDNGETRENILSYLLLRSELRGKIESPGLYFNDSINRHQNIDALLLTQGWRRYKYNQPFAAPLFAAERSLAITGQIGALLSEKKPKADVPLIMMIFGPMPGVLTDTTDQNGRFRFDINEQEGNSIDVLIQTNSKSGKQRDYSVDVDKKESPPVVFDPIRTIHRPDSIERQLIAASLERQKAREDHIRATEGIKLEEVVVTATVLSPEKKRVEERYGKPRTVISGEEIQKREQKWSYGIYSILRASFSELLFRETSIGVYAYIPNGEITLVVVDGYPVYWENYQSIASIPPSEVKSIELIHYAQNFADLFCQTSPDLCKPPGIPTRGNVIAIYTHAGKGLESARAPLGQKKFTAPVFAATREFYAPKYEQLNTDDRKKPDNRTLIHWQPRLRANEDGKASFSFYNGDQTGRQFVIVEGISADGRIGFQELEIIVEK